MAVLALNLMHDVVPAGRRARRAPIASWMAVALSRDRAQSFPVPSRMAETDVLGHGLPSPQTHLNREDPRPT
jgi:hypothetical protein